MIVSSTLQQNNSSRNLNHPLSNRRHNSFVDHTFLQQNDFSNSRKLDRLNVIFERIADRKSGGIREDKLARLLPPAKPIYDKFAYLREIEKLPKDKKLELRILSRGPFLAMFSLESNAFINILAMNEKMERERKKKHKKTSVLKTPGSLLRNTLSDKISNSNLPVREKTNKIPIVSTDISSADEDDFARKRAQTAPSDIRPSVTKLTGCDGTGLSYDKVPSKKLEFEGGSSDDKENSKKKKKKKSKRKSSSKKGVKNTSSQKKNNKRDGDEKPVRKKHGQMNSDSKKENLEKTASSSEESSRAGRQSNESGDYLDIFMGSNDITNTSKKSPTSVAFDQPLRYLSTTTDEKKMTEDLKYEKEKVPTNIVRDTGISYVTEPFPTLRSSVVSPSHQEQNKSNECFTGTVDFLKKLFPRFFMNQSVYLCVPSPVHGRPPSSLNHGVTRNLPMDTYYWDNVDAHNSYGQNINMDYNVRDARDNSKIKVSKPKNNRNRNNNPKKSNPPVEGYTGIGRQRLNSQ